MAGNLVFRTDVLLCHLNVLTVAGETPHVSSCKSTPSQTDITVLPSA